MSWLFMTLASSVFGAVALGYQYFRFWRHHFSHRHPRSSVDSPSNPKLRPLFVDKRKRLEKDRQRMSTSPQDAGEMDLSKTMKPNCRSSKTFFPFTETICPKCYQPTRVIGHLGNLERRLNLAELNMNHVWMSFGDLLWCYAFVGINAVFAWTWGLSKLLFRRKWIRCQTPDYSKVVCSFSLWHMTLYSVGNRVG